MSRILSIDVARNRDHPAFVLLHDYTITSAYRMKGAPYPELGRAFGTLARHLAADWIVIDGTGVGLALVDIMRELKDLPEIWAVVITGGKRVHVHAEDRKVSFPKRSMIKGLEAAIEHARLRMAGGSRKVLGHELAAFSRQVRDDGSEKLEAAGGEHDDLVMALAQGLAFKNAVAARIIG